jgi:hypothetical protein
MLAQTIDSTTTPGPIWRIRRSCSGVFRFYLFAPGDGGALDHVRACVRALAPSPIIALAMSPLRARTLLEAPDAIEVPLRSRTGTVRPRCHRRP